MAELGPFREEEQAEAAFEKKFKDKTGNTWAVRFELLQRGLKLARMWLWTVTLHSLHMSGFYHSHFLLLLCL